MDKKSPELDLDDDRLLDEDPEKLLDDSEEALPGLDDSADSADSADQLDSLPDASAEKMSESIAEPVRAAAEQAAPKVQKAVDAAVGKAPEAVRAAEQAAQPVIQKAAPAAQTATPAPAPAPAAEMAPTAPGPDVGQAFDELVLALGQVMQAVPAWVLIVIVVVLAVAVGVLVGVLISRRGACDDAAAREAFASSRGMQERIADLRALASRKGTTEARAPDLDAVKDQKTLLAAWRSLAELAKSREPDDVASVEAGFEYIFGFRNFHPPRF